jgi:hypothetical protein
MEKIIYSSVVCMALIFMPASTFSQNIQGTYAIKNIETGMLLRIKDANKSNGTPLVAYSPVNWKCVTWDFKHVDGQSYQLRNLFTGKTFQPVNSTPSDGNLLQQEPLISKQANQQYEFIPVQKDIYLIRLKGTDLYITPSDNKGTINSEIILAEKNGSKLQQWEIYEQKPEI